MSTALQNRFGDIINEQDIETIEFEFTAEQTKVLARAAAGLPGEAELEVGAAHLTQPQPATIAVRGAESVDTLADALPWRLHQETPQQDEALSLPVPETRSLQETVPLQETLAFREALALLDTPALPETLPAPETITPENAAAKSPTSREHSLERGEQTGKPPRVRQVGPVIRSLLHAGLLSGIVYVNPTGESPAPVAQNVNSQAAPVAVESTEAVASADNGPVRITNPFDRTESFEFPPGTSKADAREAVAKVLRERALDRLPVLAEAPHRRGAAAKR